MTIRFRTTQIEEARLKKAADYTNMSVHAFVRSMSLSVARHIIKRHELGDVELHVAEFDVPILEGAETVAAAQSTSSTTVHKRTGTDDE